MKKSYKRLALFAFILILLFLLNSFVFKILSQPLLNGIVIFLIIISYFLFGFEKDRHRYTKDIILEIIIILISFFLLYYLLGILVGFAKTANYLTIKSIVKIIIPLIIYIVLKEFLRYQLLTKASENKALITIITIFYIMMDLTIPFSFHSLTLGKEIFLLIAVTFLPIVTENILLSFLSLNFGYKPSILYLIIIKLYWYILPIVPNPNEYIYSLIFFLLPVVILLKIKKWLAKDRVESIVENSYKKRKSELIYYIPSILLVFTLAYFVSGYFRYYAIAVASGSMEDVIYKGDVVIVDQKYKDFTSTDIIAYKYNDKVVVHRIYKIIDINDSYYIYTKGDANKEYDKYKITKDMIIGVVKFKIPFIGYPTVLLNEKW